MSIPICWKTRNTLHPFIAVWRSIWRYVKHMEDHSGKPGIKIRHKTSMVTALSSTKATKSDAQKVSWKSCKVESAQRCKWLWIGSTFLCLTRVKTNEVIFLSNFWNLNDLLKCRPYPMPEYLTWYLKKNDLNKLRRWT